MELEEALKRIKYIQDFSKRTGINYALETDDETAISVVLQALEEKDKIIEDRTNDIIHMQKEIDNSISKDKIRFYIDELNNSDGLEDSIAIPYLKKIIGGKVMEDKYINKILNFSDKNINNA